MSDSLWKVCTWPAGHPSGLLETTRTDLSGCSDIFTDEAAVLREVQTRNTLGSKCRLLVYVAQDQQSHSQGYPSGTNKGPTG